METVHMQTDCHCQQPLMTKQTGDSPLLQSPLLTENSTFTVRRSNVENEQIKMNGTHSINCKGIDKGDKLRP